MIRTRALGLVSATALLAGVSYCQVGDLKKGPDRKAILDLIRHDSSKFWKQPVTFRVDHISISEKWAVVEVTALNKQLKVINAAKVYPNTEISNITIAAFGRKDSKWRKLRVEIGGGEPAFIGWKKLGIPKRMFSKGVQDAWNWD